MNEFLPQPKPVRASKSAKPKKKVKKKAGVPKNVRQKCLSEMQKLRKLQESYNGQCTCISCGKLLTIGDTNCQGGHYISRMNRATELEPDNIFPQCSICNILKSGNPILYRYNLINKIGIERVERLENMALAREGNEEALSKLSAEDREKALAKKSDKYYQTEYQRIKELVKRLEES